MSKISRRTFVSTIPAMGAALFFQTRILSSSRGESRRPPVSERTFRSPAVERVIADAISRIKDPEMAWLFSNCFPNTLDTTIDFSIDKAGNPDTFIITGDIPALWIRDSVGQVWPYLPYLKEDLQLERLFEGLIRRHALCLRWDPWSNSFIKEQVVNPKNRTVQEPPPGVWARRWQLDSFGYIIRLAHGYWKAGGNPACLDEQWLESIQGILEVMEIHRAGTDEIDPATYPYRWQRKNVDPFESLPMAGMGQPGRRCGLIRSHFRPSDDFCLFPFHIPGNAMTAVAYRQLADIVEARNLDQGLPNKFRSEATALEEALHKQAVFHHPDYGEIYAYEVDGSGSRFFADDANGPNLIGLPYFGYGGWEDKVYQNTRKFVLSQDNPYYVRGKALEGISSAHVTSLWNHPDPAIQGMGFVWPQGIAMQGLSSRDEKEIEHCLLQLKTSNAGTGFMHEVAWKDDPKLFRRPWFAWANSLFGEFVLHVLKTRPHLLT